MSSILEKAKQILERSGATKQAELVGKTIERRDERRKASSSSSSPKTSTPSPIKPSPPSSTAGRDKVMGSIINILPPSTQNKIRIEQMKQSMKDSTPVKTKAGVSSSGGLSYRSVTPVTPTRTVVDPKTGMVTEYYGSLKSSGSGITPIPEKKLDRTTSSGITYGEPINKDKNVYYPAWGGKVESRDPYKTLALVEHGYKPDDPDYDILRGEITSQVSTSKSSFDTEKSLYWKNLKETRKNIAMVHGSPEGSTFYLDDDSGVVYSKQDTLKQLSSTFMGNIRMMPSLIRQERDIKIYEKKMERFSKELTKREEGGFLVDVSRDTSDKITGVSFKEPDVEDVWKYKYGDSALGTSRLVASGAMELGIPSLMTGAASLVTGDSSYWENEVKRHQEKLLRLSMHKGEGGTGVLSYAGRFWTSRESIESFWIPVATLGAGYVYTGIKAGATGAVTVGRLATVGAKIGTKIKYVDKALFGVGLVGSGMVGANIGSTFAYEHAGRLPTGSGITTIGKTLSTVTLAAGGMYTGSKMYMSSHTPPVYKSGLKFDESLSISKGDIYQSQLSARSRLFASSEKPFVQIGKDGSVVRGTVQHTGMTIDVTGKQHISIGRLTVRRDWTSFWGTKYSTTKFDIGFTGRSFKTPYTTGSGKPIYFEQTMFTDYATGVKTYASGYGYMAPTGKEVSILKSVGVDYVKTGLFSKSPISLSETVGKVPEFKSFSLGEYSSLGKSLGKGVDISKIYSISAEGFSSGSRGISIIGGGGTLSSQSVIGNLISSTGVKLAPVSFKPVSSLSIAPVTVMGSSVSSSVSMPMYSYASVGLISVPKNISVNVPKPIQLSIPKYDTILRYDTKLSPITIQKVEQLTSPVVTSKYDVVSMLKPVSLTSYISSQAYQTSSVLASALKSASAIGSIQPVHSFGLFTSPPLPPVTPIVPLFGGGGFSGGRGYRSPRFYSKGYRYRTWKVPTLESLLPGYKNNIKKWSM